MTSNNPVVSTVIKNYNFTQNAFLPKLITMPLTEEIDVNYQSLVKPGDIVREGEVIAVSTNLNSPSHIHSSIPGKVIDIVPCYYPNGKQGYGIQIKFCGPLTYIGKKIDEQNVSYLSPSAISDAISNNGIVNTFDITYPKNLGEQIKQNKKKRCLIVRMFDEDSYRISDSLVSKFYCKEIIKGTELIAKAMDAEGIVFATDIKQNKSEEFNDVKLPNFRILGMNLKKYPCGTPREIVSAFRRTGLSKTSNFEINKSDLFIDSETAYEVYKSLVLNIPPISKPVYFSGNCIPSSGMLDVKLGTSIKALASQVGNFLAPPEIVIVNGELCGYSIQSLDAPITKYVKSIEFISNRKFTDNQIYDCVNCGNCRTVCPVHISPDILYNTTVNFQPVTESFAKSSLSCISCGLCNTVCPARLPLSQTISVLRENVTNLLKDKK